MEKVYVLARCPAGHEVDSDECPYPIVREGGWFRVICVDPECGWSFDAPSEAEAIKGWNQRK